MANEDLPPLQYGIGKPENIRHTFDFSLTGGLDELKKRLPFLDRADEHELGYDFEETKREDGNLIILCTKLKLLPQLAQQLVQNRPTNLDQAILDQKNTDNNVVFRAATIFEIRQLISFISQLYPHDTDIWFQLLEAHRPGTTYPVLWDAVESNFFYHIAPLLTRLADTDRSKTFDLLDTRDGTTDRTVLHAIFGAKQVSSYKLVDTIKYIYASDRERLKQLVQMRDSDGDSFDSYLFKCQNLKPAIEVLNFAFADDPDYLRAYYSTPSTNYISTVSKILYSKDVEELLPLVEPLFRDHPDALRHIFEKEINPKDILKDAARRNALAAVMQLLRHILDYDFTDPDVEDRPGVLTYGEALFHFTRNSGYLDQFVNGLLNTFEDRPQELRRLLQYTEVEQHQYDNGGNYEIIGNSVLHVAAKSGQLATLFPLIEYAYRDDPKELRSLLRRRNSYGHTLIPYLKDINQIDALIPFLDLAFAGDPEAVGGFITYLPGEIHRRLHSLFLNSPDSVSTAASLVERLSSGYKRQLIFSPTTPEIIRDVILARYESPTPDAVFQVGRLIPNLIEKYANSAYAAYVESADGSEGKKNVPHVLTDARGDELILQFGPTPSEARSAYDQDISDMRKHYGELLETMGFKRNIYQPPENITPESEDVDEVLRRLFTPGTVEYTPDLLATDLHRDPLSPPGRIARMGLWGGDPVDSELDKYLRLVFPRADFPMLHKPDPQYLPMPLSPNDWLDFARKLAAGSRPDIAQGRLLDRIQIQGVISTSLNEIIGNAHITRTEALSRQVLSFSKLLSQYLIDVTYADDRTKIVDPAQVYQRPVVTRILDPENEDDLADFLRYRFAGDPRERLVKDGRINTEEAFDTGRLAHDPDFAVAVLYENRYDSDIVISPEDNDAQGSDTSPMYMDQIPNHPVTRLAIGYVTITVGAIRDNEESEARKVIILSDAELAAYRSPANVADTLLTLAHHLRDKTGLPVVLSSVYSKVFKSETDLSIPPDTTLISRNSKINIPDQTGIPAGKEVQLRNTSDRSRLGYNYNWYLVS